MAQAPASATADSMPRSVIAAELADIIASPEEMPAQISAYFNAPPVAFPVDAEGAPGAVSALEKIVILLRSRTGHDFSLYKSSTLYRRIERRIALHQISGIGDYAVFLRENPQELDLLFKELLIGVTSFFRDPGVWAFLGESVFPTLLAVRPAGSVLRAWVPACSSGEEAYTLAIVFKEALDQLRPEERVSLQIYATDLDPDAIGEARKGVYPENIAADVTPERLSRYFVKEAAGYRVSKDIRDMVVFATQNIVSDPPFTKLDVISCRNLLIYFGPQLQKKLLPLFHYALSRHGVLVLGSAETVGSFGELFVPLDGKARIFQRCDRRLSSSQIDFPAKVKQEPAMTPVARTETPDTLANLTDQLIQQNYAPAAVLVNADGDILYISGRTGKYLEPAAGKVNINIQAMAREGLREALTGVIRNALRQTQPIQLNGLQVGNNGGTQIVDVTVQRLDKPDILSGRVLIVFNDVPTPIAGQPRRKGNTADALAALELELQQTRESLRITHEEMQTSMEELKSSNEELQSTNEELQSTNEELTTSKEELQSLNEELQTVNGELQSKVDELTGIRNDMTNLLNSTEIATVFLDVDMKVRRFTAHATKLFKLIPGDVGRPLSDIVSELDYAGIEEDAHAVLRTLIFREKQAQTREGQWYRLRIMPYQADAKPTRPRTGQAILFESHAHFSARFNISIRFD